MKTGLIALALLALVVGGSKMVPRGLRNNNPFNIKDSRIKWQGETGLNDDKTFEEFKNPVDGIRAGVKILLTYKRKYGIDTVRGLINRFAPPVENDTGAYVDHVAAKIGVDPDQKIDIEQHLAALSESIIKHENGFNPYSIRTIELGVEAAYV